MRPYVSSLIAYPSSPAHLFLSRSTKSRNIAANVAIALYDLSLAVLLKYRVRDDVKIFALSLTL